MKNGIILILALALFSCSKSEGNGGQEVTPPGTPEVVYSGPFINGGHPTMGKAEVINNSGNKELKLVNFKTEAGPDLYVYLATDEAAAAFINLGKLKSTEGDQTYSINGLPDFDRYTYVLIWCQQFGVLFGSAKLQ